MKEKKLVKESYWNPYFVNTSNRGGHYELDNIVIYNEKGLLIETGCGWFNESNNHTENTEIKNDILKINTGTEEKHIKEKHNFIIKTKNSYKDGYTLYLYYKNINYKPVAIVKRSLFVEVDYQLFNNNEKTYSKAIGNSRKYSQEIYSELRKEIEKTEKNTYRYDEHMEELEQQLKNIKKLMKKYEKIKEEEKNYSIDKFVTGTATDKTQNKESYKNNIEMLESGEM